VMLVAAMIPIATGRGPGAGARASMAKVILGGQLLSLLLSLLVTPVAYSIWDDLLNRGHRIAAWVRTRRDRSEPPLPPEHDETKETVPELPVVARDEEREADAVPTGS
jgi:HAE1 family hydrophobic/amphiphilic exporter-1